MPKHNAMTVEQCFNIIWNGKQWEKGGEGVIQFFKACSSQQKEMAEKAIFKLSQDIMSGDYDQGTFRYSSRSNIINIRNTLVRTFMQLNSKEKEQCFHEQHFSNYLEGIVKSIPIQKKSMKNETLLQCRMDSLSRILSVPSKLSACIAVALMGDKLYIAANTPSDFMQFKNKVTKKLNLLRGLIRQFESSSDIVELQHKRALDTALSLCYNPDGGVDTAPGRLRKPQDSVQSTQNRLKIDLLKFAEFYQYGFSPLQQEALMQHDPVFEVPNRLKEAETGLKLHSEQLMLLCVGHFYHQVIDHLCDALIPIIETDKDSISPLIQTIIQQMFAKYGINPESVTPLLEKIMNSVKTTEPPFLKKEIRTLLASSLIQTQEPIAIGIDKLACDACTSVLDQHTELVQYRGSANMCYLGTMDVTQEREFHSLYKIGDRNISFPEDSDSCSEYANTSDDSPQKTAYQSFSFFCRQSSSGSVNSRRAMEEGDRYRTRYAPYH